MPTPAVALLALLTNLEHVEGEARRRRHAAFDERQMALVTLQRHGQWHESHHPSRRSHWRSAAQAYWNGTDVPSSEMASFARRSRPACDRERTPSQSFRDHCAALDPDRTRAAGRPRHLARQLMDFRGLWDWRRAHRAARALLSPA